MTAFTEESGVDVRTVQSRTEATSRSCSDMSRETLCFSLRLQYPSNQRHNPTVKQHIFTSHFKRRLSKKLKQLPKNCERGRAVHSLSVIRKSLLAQPGRHHRRCRPWKGLWWLVYTWRYQLI